MSIPHHAQMHEAHLRWQAEHVVWMAEIDRWQTENVAALGEVAELKALLQQHDDLLRAHAGAIRAHGDRLQDHEVAVAEVDQGGLEGRRDEVLAAHFSQIDDHTGQRVRHADLDRHHRAVHERLQALLQVLREGPAGHRQA